MKTKTDEGKKALIMTPKTKASKRSIHLNNMLVACLERQKRCRKRIRVYKEIYEDKNMIFASETGDYISPKKILREVKKTYKLSGISPTHTFHDLRHKFCSLMINKNINAKVISEVLGHSSVTITLDVYSTI